MKTLLITTLSVALLVLVPACTTEVDARSSDSGHSATTTSRESTSISTPVGSASQSTTVRRSSY